MKAYLETYLIIKFLNKSKSLLLNRSKDFLNRSKSLFKIDHKASIIIKICEIIIIIVIII